MLVQTSSTHYSSLKLPTNPLNHYNPPLQRAVAPPAKSKKMALLQIAIFCFFIQSEPEASIKYQLCMHSVIIELCLDDPSLYVATVYYCINDSHLSEMYDIVLFECVSAAQKRAT